MTEYIERGALMQFPIRRDHYDRKNGNEHFMNGIESVLEYAENLPAADVAPVVRCKDCKWFADNNDGDWLGCWLFQTIQIIPEDAPKPEDFCSYGEPKMDGGGDR